MENNIDKHDYDEIISLLRQNNYMLKEIKKTIDNIDSDESMLKTLGRSFGMGICSTIVGDRILGLGNRNR